MLQFVRDDSNDGISGAYTMQKQKQQQQNVN